MPKAQSKENVKEERNLIIRFFLFFVNTLILLGYIIIYPFENLILIIKKLFSSLAEKLRKPLNLKKMLLFIPKKSQGFWIWVSAQIKVGLLNKKERKSRATRVAKAKKLKEKKKRLRKEKKKRRTFTFFKVMFIFFFGIFFGLLFIAIPAFGYYWYLELPSPELLEQQTQNSTTKILDRNGRVLYEIYIDKKYDPVPLKRVPDNVINATLAIEDAAFYSHPGFDVKGILRAAKSTLLENNVQGGSTITQQLIKNVLLTPERTYVRKLKELVLAISVEQKYSKNQILEFYLNNIPYGGTSYGIQSAAQKYFGKNVWDLDLAEASMLAGLPSSPTVYSPLGGNIELAKGRQKQVLTRMYQLGYITGEEAVDAFEKDLEFAPQVEYIRAPHFVNYVRQDLYDRFGQRAVDFGGLTVTTTLDLDMQDEVQKIVSEEVEKNGTKLNFTNGAAVILDSKTGQIMAYVGSVDFFADDGGRFDVVTAYRQPGSSIKPVTYALALEQGDTALTTIEDKPITYQFSGQKYTPKNYDNKYHGTVTLRQALANSYNIPAVKLVNKVGVDNMVQLGINLGFSNWVVGDGTYGMAVTLGGKEVRLLDLTNAYSTFSRQGIYRDVTPYLSVKDIYGYEVLGLVNKNQRQVLSPETSYIITSILSDNNARTPAFGPNSQLVIKDKTVAVKTGTTNDIRDNLTIGYTPTYTVGVWVGNNDNSTMNNNLASGLTGAAPIWNRIMSFILEGEPNEEFPVPEGIVIKSDKSCPNKFEVFDKNHKIPDTICIKKTNKDNQDKNSKKNN